VLQVGNSSSSERIYFSIMRWTEKIRSHRQCLQMSVLSLNFTCCVYFVYLYFITNSTSVTIAFIIFLVSCWTTFSIEDQHVQFKVEPNNLDIDAAQIAKTLENDINIQKRLTDNLGVDISKVAAGDKVSASFHWIFPNWMRSLNWKIFCNLTMLLIVFESNGFIDSKHFILNYISNSLLKMFLMKSVIQVLSQLAFIFNSIETCFWKNLSKTLFNSS